MAFKHALILVLSLLLTASTLAKPDTGKLYPSKDGTFSVRLSPEFFQRLSDSNTSAFNAVSVDGTLMMVVMQSSASKVPIAKIKHDFPNWAGSTWKVLGSGDNEVGGKPAVFYRLSNVFPAPETDSAQFLKQFELPADSKYQTLMAIVPTTKGTYTFQVHHHQSLGDQGLQGAVGLLKQLVSWN